MDGHLLPPGEYFDGLPETYVIFITEHDIIGGGKPIYRIDWYIEDIAEGEGLTVGQVKEIADEKIA